MIEPCAQLIAQMRAPLGLHACMGNHDVGTDEAHIPPYSQSTEFQCCGTVPFLSNAMAQDSGSADWMTFWKETRSQAGFERCSTGRTGRPAGP